MPDPQTLFDVLLGRSKPNPDMQPQFTPESQGLPDDPILQGSNFLLGAAGLGDNSSASRLGGLAGAVVPFAGAKWRPVREEIDALIAEHQLDPMQAALAGRVTPTKVFHRTPINAPEGFEFKEGFGPNYTPRSQVMNDRFVAQKAQEQRAIEESAAKVSAVPGRKSILGGGSTNKSTRGAKLTENQVGQVKGMLEAGIDRETITKQTNVGASTVAQIARGEVWNKVKAIPVAKASK